MNLHFAGQHFLRVPNPSISNRQTAESQDAESKSTSQSFESKLPQAVQDLTKYFHRMNFSQVSRLDLSELVNLLRDKEIRKEVINCLSENIPKDSLCGHRIALSLALSKLIKDDPAILQVVLNQVTAVPKQTDLFQAIGNEVEKLPVVILDRLSAVIIHHATPYYLSQNSYGSDKSLEPWVELIIDADRGFLPDKIYEELDKRVKDGKQSGYQHIITLLSRMDPHIAAPVCTQIALEAADSKYLHYPNLGIRFGLSMMVPTAVAASAWFAVKGLATSEVFYNYYLNYPTGLCVFYAMALGVISFTKREYVLKQLANASDKPSKISLAMRCIDVLNETLSRRDSKDLFYYLIDFNHLDKNVTDHCLEKIQG